MYNSLRHEFLDIRDSDVVYGNYLWCLLIVPTLTQFVIVTTLQHTENSILRFVFKLVILLTNELFLAQFTEIT